MKTLVPAKSFKNRCPVTFGKSRQVFVRAAFVLLVVFAWTISPAHALQISFDGITTIVDGGAGDTDGLVNGNISFTGIYGVAGYGVSGDLYLCPPGTPGSSLTGLLTPLTQSLTLTNLKVDALSTSTLNTYLNIQFEDIFAGSFTGVTAAQVITPFVGSVTNSPVAALSDELVNYDTFLTDAFSGTSVIPGGFTPLFNPAHPGPGTTPWTVASAGPTPIPNLTNPTMTTRLSLRLGAFDDRFQLLSSAEAGFYAATPEPSSWLLSVMGTLGTVAIGWRCRKRAARAV